MMMMMKELRKGYRMLKEEEEYEEWLLSVTVYLFIIHLCTYIFIALVII